MNNTGARYGAGSDRESPGTTCLCSFGKVPWYSSTAGRARPLLALRSPATWRLVRESFGVCRKLYREHGLERVCLGDITLETSPHHMAYNRVWRVPLSSKNTHRALDRHAGLDTRHESQIAITGRVSYFRHMCRLPLQSAHFPVGRRGRLCQLNTIQISYRPPTWRPPGHLYTDVLVHVATSCLQGELALINLRIYYCTQTSASSVLTMTASTAHFSNASVVFACNAQTLDIGKEKRSLSLIRTTMDPSRLFNFIPLHMRIYLFRSFWRRARGVLH